MEELKLVLERRCGQRTNDHTLTKQLHFICGRAFGGARGRGWEHSVSLLAAKSDSGGAWIFTGEITYKKIDGRVRDSNVAQIIEFARSAGCHSQFKQYPWMITVGGEKAQGQEEEEANDLRDYAEIGTQRGHHFDHIYGREAHISIIHSAIMAAVHSDFRNRFHCVLFGEPGCGKTDILIAVGNMLGAEGEAFVKFDGTGTTEAGAREMLMRAPYVPPVILVEEIEKAEEKSTRWLLGVLDQRAEIRRTNFRVGHQARNVKMLCLATVNDIELFGKVHSGALASRFMNKIHCPRPDRVLLKKILEREVMKDGGRQEWIEPTLCLVHDTLKSNSPRDCISVCLCGRDALLSGKYQKYILATREPQKGIE